jgi:3-deoxy-D-manno-octulosonate 8-phosphate phosphatase (KDO 8-P phosphatase)
MEDLPAVAAARNIRMLLLDVDGVLTDGRLYYGESGEEYKSFNIKDGLGIKLLQRAGIEVGIITARKSSLVARRCRELGIKRVIQGRQDKMVALNELVKELNIAMRQIAYIGDDLPDLGPIKNVGLGMTVADANHVLKENALWCSQAPGGFGAVREAAEFILTAQDKLQALIQSHQ